MYVHKYNTHIYVYLYKYIETETKRKIVNTSSERGSYK